MLLSVPATLYLWKRCGGDLGKKLSLLVFGLSLAFCYAGSTLYHGVRCSQAAIAAFNLLDYVGIYVLIAGSYTPLAWNLLRGRWRAVTLGGAWLMAAAGSAVQVVFRTLPQSVTTGLYLAMGWGAIFCYFEIARRLSHRPLRPILVGGILYTVGAVLNLAGWPVLWPGVCGAHEVFHLFVMAGSLVALPVHAGRGGALRGGPAAQPGTGPQARARRVRQVAGAGSARRVMIRRAGFIRRLTNWQVATCPTNESSLGRLDPAAEHLGDAPRLGDAAAGGVGGLGVEDLADRADAASPRCRRSPRASAARRRGRRGAASARRR